MKKSMLLALLLLIAVAAGSFVSANQASPPFEMKTPINTNAPVKSKGEITIEAPVEEVWHILTTINEWPSWQSEVTSAILEGEPAEGAEFHWKAGGLSFSSTIHTNQPMSEFGWTGKTFGANAIHNWYFASENGRTVIRVEESLQGVFPRLLRKSFQKNLDKGIETNLNDLKRAAE
ncbi:MAG: SRPBCC family protein [Bacteroidales bacterium]